MNQKISLPRPTKEPIPRFRVGDTAWTIYSSGMPVMHKVVTVARYENKSSVYFKIELDSGIGYMKPEREYFTRAEILAKWDETAATIRREILLA